jgi:hypothetical protein
VSWERLSVPVLVKTWVRWVLTVATPISRRCAISALESPSAARAATLVSVGPGQVQLPNDLDEHVRPWTRRNACGLGDAVGYLLS